MWSYNVQPVLLLRYLMFTMQQTLSNSTFGVAMSTYAVKSDNNDSKIEAGSELWSYVVMKYS